MTLEMKKIGDFVSLRQGLAINKGTAHLVSDNKTENYIYPLLRIADMLDGSFHKYISRNVQPSVIARPEDIIYTRTGQIGLAFRGFNGCVHNNSFIVSLESNEITKDYLFVILQSDFVRSQALSMAKNSVQPDLTHGMFKNIVIPIPDLENQKKIVDIYLQLVNKIRLNSKIIETSKKLMREIYDYWFVQFDFPDENCRPYKSSGGEMVYDEKLKREIPKEWKAIDLSNLVKNRTEATIGTHDDKCIDLSIMPSDNIVLDKYNFGDSFSSNMKTMKKGDILFGSIRPYLRKAGIAPYDGVRAGTVHCFYAKNTIDSSMCSVMMTSEDMFQYAIMKSGGSTRMPSVSAKDILSYSFAYNQEISSKYNDICSDLINQIILLINENISLAYLRDWLLPMLMNGQVKIEDK